MICDREDFLQLFSTSPPLTKQSQIDQHKIIKRVASEGVSKITFYIKKKCFRFLCKKPITPGRKQPQIVIDYTTKCVGIQYFLNLNFNSFLKIIQMVTIHACKYSKYSRGNILVWVVVNCKIPLVEIFYNKEQALALVSILHEYERLTTPNNTNTIYVERSPDRLTGLIPKEKK